MEIVSVNTGFSGADRKFITANCPAGKIVLGGGALTIAAGAVPERRCNSVEFIPDRVGVVGLRRGSSRIPGRGDLGARRPCNLRYC